MTPCETVHGLVKDGVLLVSIVLSGKHSMEIREEALRLMRLNVTTFCSK